MNVAFSRNVKFKITAKYMLAIPNKLRGSTSDPHAPVTGHVATNRVCSYMPCYNERHTTFRACKWLNDGCSILVVG